MRILFVAPQVPWPANKGDRQRSYALLRALAREHEVTLSCPGTLEEHAACAEGLGHLVAGFLPVTPAAGRREGWPATPGRLTRLARFAKDLVVDPVPFAFRYRTPDYASFLRPYRFDFDAVFCRYLYMLPAMRDFPARRVVVDADDLYYLGLLRSARNGSYGWGSPLLLAEAARSYAYERHRYREVARVLVCSEADAARIGGARKSVVPNGIDLPDPALLKEAPSPRTLVFVGQMSYEPNADGLRWFLARVWPRLTRLVPDVRLLVVGRKADGQTLPFARMPRVELVGEVPETASWFSSATLSVAPLRVGLGTRIKIIESLACGRPVVSTRVGAEGLGAFDERTGLFRTGSPRAMARRIAALLGDPGLADASAARGRALVASRFTWDATTGTLASDIEEWVGSASVRAAAASPMRAWRTPAATNDTADDRGRAGRLLERPR